MQQIADIVSGKPFSQFLEELEHGEFNHDCTRQLNKLVNEVRATGKAGSLKISIKLKPTDHTARQVEIDKDLDISLPKYPRQKSLAFTNEDGSLSREDPRQLNMEYQDHE